MIPLFAMKNLLKPFAIVPVILSCNILLAQKKNVSGYYIDTQGDTVRGSFTKYAQWSKNPQQVEFLSDNGQVLLSPANCNRFSVAGYDTYISYTGKRLLNPIDDGVVMDYKTLISDKDSSEQVSVFLRLATNTAGVSLYVLNDNNRINYFYQLPGQPVVELAYKKFYSENQVGDVSEYQKQLYVSFGSLVYEKNLTTALEQLPYREKDLSSFFKKLFPSPGTANARPVNKAKWIVAAGTSINMIATKGDGNTAFVPKSFPATVAPLVSLGYLIPVDRNFGRYFVFPQLKLFNYKTTGEIPQYSLTKEVTYKAPLAVALDVNGGVNIINKEKLTFFVVAGGGLLAQINAKQIEQLYTSANHTPQYAPHETTLPWLTFCLNAGAGVTINQKVFISADYKLPTSITNFVAYRITLSAVQLKLGYAF